MNVPLSAIPGQTYPATFRDQACLAGGQACLAGRQVESGATPGNFAALLLALLNRDLETGLPGQQTGMLPDDLLAHLAGAGGPEVMMEPAASAGVSSPGDPAGGRVAATAVAVPGSGLGAPSTAAQVQVPVVGSAQVLSGGQQIMVSMAPVSAGDQQVPSATVLPSQQTGAGSAQVPVMSSTLTSPGSPSHMAAAPAGPTAAELPMVLTREATQPVAVPERPAVFTTSLPGQQSQQSGDRPVLVPSANPAVSEPPPTVVVREAAQPASPSMARQLTEAVMFQVRRSPAGTGQVLRVQVALDPPQLGRVTLELTFGRNGLEVQFHTPDRVVKAIIEQALPQLREALIRQEFNLGNTTVFLGQGNSQEQSARLFRGPWTGNPVSDELVSEPSDDGSRAEPAFGSGLDYLV